MSDARAALAAWESMKGKSGYTARGDALADALRALLASTEAQPPTAWERWQQAEEDMTAEGETGVPWELFARHAGWTPPEAQPPTEGFGGEPERYSHITGFAEAQPPTSALAAWWEGVNDQWKHRPVGNRIPEMANPYPAQPPTECEAWYHGQPGCSCAQPPTEWSCDHGCSAPSAICLVDHKPAQPPTEPGRLAPKGRSNYRAAYDHPTEPTDAEVLERAGRILDSHNRTIAARVVWSLAAAHRTQEGHE